ncbi:hypothetical protein NIES2119_08760 [[Phormidium ambiguum] IAM M-71]|uniref:Type II toxin-antitoxin system CcdA family antitoxin n=1 Tax=[Phormidium ambiguum] IAM M-71 TaxID=454136 RepID=A0A1U7IMZ9_9CYAN|nr:type II toxin-antitoxin system CcdA family antitoxin [Phormidium ambiguum]OKH38676.1 hypothetical protein NIES2119_08760 [Phormidium ambiguum IAM M-71]
MKEPAIDSRRSEEKVEISIHLDSDLLSQLQHLTNDPSKVIEAAIRQWLKGGVSQRDDELTRSINRIPVPPRGEWND